MDQNRSIGGRMTARQAATPVPHRRGGGTGRLRPRRLGRVIGLILGLVGVGLLGFWPAAAEPPLCALEVWTDKPSYLPGESIRLSAFIKVGDQDLARAGVRLDLTPPQGPTLKLTIELPVQLTRGLEWEGFLLTLPGLGERRDRSGLGPYELWAFVEDRETGRIYCEARTTFTLQSPFIRQPQSKTLIVTSARTDIVEQFTATLAAWLEAAYRTETRIIFDGDPLLSYNAGDYESFDVIIYYGLDFFQPPSLTFLQDIFAGEGISGRRVIWLGYHLDQVPADLLKNVGISPVELTVDSAPGSLVYLDSDTDYSLLNPDRFFVDLSDPQLARDRGAADDDRVLIASSRHRQSPDDGEYFYFFGFHPTGFLTPGGAYLVFLDLLNEVYGIERPRVALVRLEDIHAKTSAFDLLSATAFLKDERIPFSLALIPIYADGQEQEEIRLSEDRPFRVMVKRALLDGGEVAVHGASHRFDGVTAEDYEFWDEKANRPIGDTEYARRRVELALQEIRLSGLAPHTIAWETPHWQASPEHYSVFEKYFNLIDERNPNFSLEFVPYPAETVYSTYVPDTLGFIRSDHSEQDLQSLIEGARRLAGLRHGAIASFFYHPFLGVDELRTVIRELKAQGWQFVALSSLVEEVKVAFPET